MSTQAEIERKRVEEDLDGLVAQKVIRGWKLADKTYLLSYWDLSFTTDGLEVVDTGFSYPQVKAFVAGTQATMAWVGVLAEEVEKGSVTSAAEAISRRHD